MNYENNFPKKRRQPFASIVLYLREFLPYLICISIIIFLLNSILSIGSIKSGSMEATLRTGDIVIGNRLAYIASEPQAGDILFFHLNETTYCKRVIGGAGDKITFYTSTTNSSMRVPICRKMLRRTAPIHLLFLLNVSLSWEIIGSSLLIHVFGIPHIFL